MPRRLLLLSAALLALVPTAAGCGGSSSSSSSVQSAIHRAGPISIFEAEAQLRGTPPQTVVHYVGVLRSLGVDVIRLYMPWNRLAPDPLSHGRPTFDAPDPASYSPAAWSSYDSVIGAARARGMNVDLTIGAPVPVWATGKGSPPGGPHQWRPSAAQFGQFVRAVATRYSGTYRPPGAARPLPRVNFWAIWNEPNYGVDLAPQATHHSTVEVSPGLYRGLLDAAWNALQATGHGGDTVLIGEVAPRGLTIGNNPGNFSGMVPLRFIRALYCVDASFRPLQGPAAAARGCPTDAADTTRFATAHPALFHATGFSVHPYPQGRVPPNVITTDQPDYADLPALPNLERTLDKVQAIYGSDTKFPIYSTEFGLQTNPPETIERAIDSKTAAYYLNWSEYISWRNPRVSSYDQYLLTDPPTGNFATGLQYADGTPKPQLFDAYRMPLYLPVTSAKKGQAVEVWGAVRPAHYAQVDSKSPQRVNIDFQTASQGPFKTLQTVTITNSHGYFDLNMTFPSSGTVRLSWSYPNGPTIHSRPVTVTVTS